MRRALVVLGLAGLCSTIAAAQQVPPPAPEEASVIEQIRTALRFESDGRGVRDLYVRVKAQSEAGVQEWGQVVVGYNAASERVEMPFVRVRKTDGTTVETPTQSVQDLSAPVQRIAPVYTDFREKHVTVQSLRPGDTLEFRVVTTIESPLAPGQFWTEYTFNHAAIVLDEQLDIDVPAGKRITLKTLPGFDAVSKDAGGRRIYHWSHAHAVRAPEGSDRDDQKTKKDKKPDDPERASVRLTTFTDWQELGGWFAGLERAARRPTPEIQEKARQLTAGRTTDLEKVEALYDFVSKNFRYVSLSLGAGRYQPRSAPDVLREAYGDCKDKHTLLASLIEAAGFQASPVLINSSVKIDPEFPSPAQFDHMITRAVVGGQAIWLDATPEVAPFRLLAPPLRKKQALVADVSASRLEETPADPPMPMLVSTDVDGRVEASGALSAHVTLAVRGDAELVLRTVFRMTPEPDWKAVVEHIARETGVDGKLSDLKVADPQATKEPFTVAFTVDAPRFATWSAAKVDLPLPFIGNADAPRLDEDGSGPVTIGPTGEIVYRLKLELPKGTTPHPPVPVSVSRDYAEYRATYAAAGTTVTAERHVMLRISEVAESRRADCMAFVNVMTGDARQRMSVDTGPLATANVSVAPDVKVADLTQAGYDALKSGDYEHAIALLKQVVEREPKHRTAWNYLGNAYLRLRQLPAAIDAYHKQVDINPYDAYAYNNLGLAYVASEQYTEAEAAYRKQIEINPLDKAAHGNLGRMFVLRRDLEKAAPELEKATALSPDDASLQVQLGKAYLKVNRKDDAIAAFGRAVELAPDPGTWNNVAYELALGGTDLPRARQYAESAVAATAAASRNLDVDKADARSLALVRSLGSYWDTLGWVFFAEGDLARAEKYVVAAWKLDQNAEVGDHAGQIYEKTGRHDAAVTAYAQAMSARQPPPEVREHLARAAGSATAAEAQIAAHRDDLARSRTIALTGKGPAGKHADFLVVFASPGSVDAVKFVEGDEEMRALTPALQKIPADGLFPDDTASKVLRRGTAACGANGACTFTLVPPGDARPVK